MSVKVQGQLSFDNMITGSENVKVSTTETEPVDSIISASKAMQILSLSRHTFEKIVKDAILKMESFV